MDKNKRNYKGIKADERQLKKAFAYRHLTSSIPKLELKANKAHRRMDVLFSLLYEPYLNTNRLLMLS